MASSYTTKAFNPQLEPDEYNAVESGEGHKVPLTGMRDGTLGSNYGPAASEGDSNEGINEK